MLYDRRNCVRYDIPLSVAFKTLEDTSGYSLGITNNFSRKGFCLESQNFNLDLDETLTFKIELPRDGTFISVLGDIVWKKRVGSKHLVGIKLRKINKESKWEILDFCYNLWVNRMRSRN